MTIEDQYGELSEEIPNELTHLSRYANDSNALTARVYGVIRAMSVACAYP